MIGISDREIVSVALLKTVFTSENIPALFDGRETHDVALKTVNELLPHTQDEEQIAAIIEAALPEDYASDTLQQIPEMVQSGVKKGLSEQQNNKTQKLAEMCVNLVVDDTIELFHDFLMDAYIAVQIGPAQFTFSIRSAQLGLWVRKQYFDRTGKPLAKNALDEVISTLESLAIFRGNRREVHRRQAGNAGNVYIDLGDEEGRVIEITPSEWRVTSTAPVRFIRTTGMKSLPEPKPGGNLEQLQNLLGLSSKNWALVLAFIINALKPDGPYMCMLISAEQGSGKSVLCSVLKRLLDPSLAERLRLPKNDHDLMIQAKENALLVYDNVSGVKWDMSDSLSALATGSGFGTRKYFTDDSLRLFSLCRPFIINGIGEFASRPDLLERSVPLKLSPMAKGVRRTEADLYAEFEGMLPELLGCLCDVVSHALKYHDKVEPPTEVRMADAMRWLVAAEGATGLPVGTFIKALSESQTELMIDAVINDPVVIALLRVIETEPFEGTVGELHTAMNLRENSQRLPNTAAHLSNALKRLKPAIAKVGIHVEFGEKRRKGKMVRIWADWTDDDDGEANDAASY